VVQCIGSAHETTLLVDEGPLGSDGGRESPFNPGDDRGRAGPLARSPPRVSARDRAQGRLVEARGSHTVRPGRQGRRRLGFTRKGRTAQLRKRVNCLVT
jgi:hypothetical protein